jgi:Family of unknown function (DUF6585)
MFHGQPAGIYRANWILVTLFVAGAAGFGWLSSFLFKESASWLAWMVALMAFSFAAGGIYLAFITVRVFAEGVAMTSISGTTEMRWDQVESLYYQAIQHREYGIPIMTSYTLRLVDMSGNVLKIPAGLGKARNLATLVVRYTTPLIMDRLLQRFNGGERLAFGSIQISSAEGIQAKANALKTVTTPWSMFAGTQIKGGALSILRHDKGSGGVAAVSRIPNAFALQNLLARATQKGVPPSSEEQVKAARV